MASVAEEGGNIRHRNACKGSGGDSYQECPGRMSCSCLVLVLCPLFWMAQDGIFSEDTKNATPIAKFGNMAKDSQVCSSDRRTDHMETPIGSERFFTCVNFH